VRLVRTPEGNLELDESGRKTGRGAYLCPVKTCWEVAVKGNQLEHALRGTLTKQNRDYLNELGKGLFEKGAQ
jgi:hypothetical protein